MTRSRDGRPGTTRIMRIWVDMQAIDIALSRRPRDHFVKTSSPSELAVWHLLHIPPISVSERAVTDPVARSSENHLQSVCEVLQRPPLLAMAVIINTFPAESIRVFTKIVPFGNCPLPPACIPGEVGIRRDDLGGWIRGSSFIGARRKQDDTTERATDHAMNQQRPTPLGRNSADRCQSARQPPAAERTEGRCGRSPCS